MPDQDGDGADELLVGAPGEAAGAGRVRLVSGRSGAVLATATGAAASRLGTAVASAGDRDLDGVHELVAGAPAANGGAGRLVLFDAGLVEVASLEGAPGEGLGVAVAGGADLDGDGRPEVLGGAPGASPTGLVRVWRGDGSTSQAPGEWPDEGFGSSLALGPDLDLDGVADLAVGAPRSAPGGLSDAGRAAVLSGRSLALLAEARGGRAGDAAGSSVALLSDVDGDGAAELAVGSPGAASATGRVDVHGSAGAPVASFVGSVTGGRFGSALAAGPDTGEDGWPDLLVGAPRATSADGEPLAGLAAALESEPACTPWFACLPDGLEPNDRARPVPLDLGTWQGLTLCAADVDAFALAPPPGRRRVVRIAFEHARGDLDLRLFDAGGRLVDASLSLADFEEVGPFDLSLGTLRAEVSGFDGATNAYDLLVLDPDSCPPTRVVPDLRVRRSGADVVLTWGASDDPCHQRALGARAWTVYAASTPVPDGAPVAFPAGTRFADVTTTDADGDLSDEAHVAAAPAGSHCWLVADLGRAGEVGPVGAYR